MGDGTQCGGYARTGKDYCFSHDPDSKEEKALAVKKGGAVKQTRVIGELEKVRVVEPSDLITLLAKTIGEVRAGVIDTRVANTVGFLSGHLLRAYEFAETAEKLEVVQAVITGRDRRGW
jgi:hypothetical protein